ncbi:MAG: copper homeostasis protein CutC [Kurthia sp.]|nr:copper homeostasis protein CutC [Candidatus Kurthia equi]
MLEIIVTTVEDAIIAEAGGADRLELCVSLDEGGVTPSLGKIKNVINAVDIPVHVMLRPHGNSFSYTEEDFSVMLDDLRVIQLFGAKGVVLGGLTRHNHIDKILLNDLLPHCQGLDVTFHRAFDEVENQFEALEQLSQFPLITHVLTSGGIGKATQHLPQLQQLIQQSQAMHVNILVGSGITPENTGQFLEIGAKYLHVGLGVRFNHSFHSPINIEAVRSIKKMIGEFVK